MLAADHLRFRFGFSPASFVQDLFLRVPSTGEQVWLEELRGMKFLLTSTSVRKVLSKRVDTLKGSKRFFAQIRFNNMVSS
ncbi:MAG: hypothetical protein A3J52_01530 [Omnitrophica bacterium RIFCSPHIGHO2_02_FULL_49_9]|nr:MAG: hypothetical protein A3J52_01530 [Omnitrophica bacterium RIFCSPHIGHO2_02_FULL_49_9]